MNVEAATNHLDTNSNDIATTTELDAQLKGRSGSTSNGPIIGLALMASISLPLVCMAALRMREPQVTQPGQVTPAAVQAVAAQPTSPKYIYWNYNFQAAQQLAASTNKPMMIDFYTDWCPACKLLDAGAFSDPNVTGAAQGFVPVKINAEGQPDLARKYNVTKYPTIIWTDSAGNEKHREVGAGSAEKVFYNMQDNA
jgi:thiol:disulfide interchange protein